MAAFSDRRDGARSPPPPADWGPDWCFPFEIEAAQANRGPALPAERLYDCRLSHLGAGLGPSGRQGVKATGERQLRQRLGRPLQRGMAEAAFPGRAQRGEVKSRCVKAAEGVPALGGRSVVWAQWPSA